MVRFERWCRSVRDVDTSAIEKTLPPVDVVMVWHTYLLNPMYVNGIISHVYSLIYVVSWYAEDTMRLSILSSLPNYTEYLTAHLVSTHFSF